MDEHGVPGGLARSTCWMRTEYLVDEHGVPGWMRTAYLVDKNGENGVPGWMRTEYLGE